MNTYIRIHLQFDKYVSIIVPKFEGTFIGFVVFLVVAPIVIMSICISTPIIFWATLMGYSKFYPGQFAAWAITNGYNVKTFSNGYVLVNSKHAFLSYELART